MKVNELGINLIKSFESLSLKPYKDLVGIWTIGWGTTHYPDGRPVLGADKPLTEALAEAYLMFEIEEKAKVIQSFLDSIKLTLNENQFAALVSFAYNVGVGPIISSGRGVNIALRSKDLGKVAESLLQYNKATKLGIKIEVKGLTRRREAEKQLFNK